MATNGTKWRQNGEKMGTKSKWRTKWRQNGEKMAKKWRKNGDKMAIKWR